VSKAAENRAVGFRYRWHQIGELVRQIHADGAIEANDNAYSVLRTLIGETYLRTPSPAGRLLSTDVHCLTSSESSLDELRGGFALSMTVIL
jgi:hypothetical protein